MKNKTFSYCEYSNTIRQQPQNYCLAVLSRQRKSWQLDFDLAANRKFAHIVVDFFFDFDNKYNSNGEELVKKLNMMVLLEFNNEPTKIITEEEAVAYMQTLCINWFGFENFSSNDQDMLSEKTDVFFEPICNPTYNGTFRLHDLNHKFID
jgi:hypothetical protein